MNDLIARELSNGTWFIINLVFWLTTVFYLGHRLRKPWAGVTRELGTQTAFALSVFLAGSLLRSGYIWILLFLQNTGRNTAVLENLYVVIFVSAGLAIVGGILCIRVFSRRNWGRRFWMVTAVLSVVIPILVHLYL